MTDYRGFFKAKLADIENRFAALESERTEVLAVLKSLDAADAALARKAPSPERNGTSVPAMPTAIIGILRACGRMLTADEIYTRLADEREVSRPHLYSALHRLKTRNKTFKANKKWGLVGRDDRADGQGQSTTLLTSPNEPGPQPMRSHVSEPA